MEGNDHSDCPVELRPRQEHRAAQTSCCEESVSGNKGLSVPLRTSHQVQSDASFSSGSAVDLRPPPTDTDEQKTPVLEELRRFALEGVPDKLEHPSKYEQGQPIPPQAVEEYAPEKKWEREQDNRNAQGVTNPVHGMLMAGGVLCNPLLVSAIAQHAEG
jgi:hypothetical protein